MIEGLRSRGRIASVEITAIGKPGSPPAKGVGRECVTPLSGLGIADDTMRSGLPPATVWTVLVEVRDQDGRVGIGSAGFGTLAACSVIEDHLAPLIVGRSPFDVELLWETMYLSTLNFGRKGAVVAAVSAVDIALWDLLGHVMGVPTYQLIGGRTKDRIQVYASRLYASEDLDALAGEATAYVNAGFSAVKQRLAYGPRDGRAGMAKNLELVQAVSAAIPSDVAHMADAYMGWDTNYAVQMIHKIENAGIRLAWIEEPVRPDNIRGLATIRRSVDTPIAAGEHEYTRFGIRDMILAEAVDILQPDFNRAGGITEAKKIVALASAFDIPVIPHAGQMHNYHVVMSSPGCPMAEHFIRPGVGVVPDEDEIFYRVFDGEPDASQGSVDLDPNLPGLGLSLNEEFVLAHRVVL